MDSFGNLRLNLSTEKVALLRYFMSQCTFSTVNTDMLMSASCLLQQIVKNPFWKLQHGGYILALESLALLAAEIRNKQDRPSNLLLTLA